MTKIKNLTLGLLFALTGGVSFAQNGLEGIIVEKYYVSDSADANGSVGTLPERSVTYRVFADMLPGYNFQAMYGVAGHTLLINSTTPFFNNEDRGNTNPAIGAAFINDNTVALDSWFSVGGAANGQLGIPKSEDNGSANLISGDPILQNTDPEIGIPLTTQDGIVSGTPVAVTFVGLSTELDVFDALSIVGNSFTTSNGSIAALGGSVGPVPTTNKVLIGQFTTDGTFHFELNIQIGTPLGGTQNYVAANPVGAEISIPSLIFSSTPLMPLAASSISICEGTTASQLTAVISPDCSLNWYTVPTGGTASSTAPIPATTTTGTTTFYVSQTNGAGNESERTAIDVVINPAPTAAISASGPLTFCSGDSVILVSGAISGNVWSTSETNDSIIVMTSGSYDVTVTNGFGCSATSTITTITVNPLPAPSISAGGPTSFCSGGSVVLTSSASSGNMWSTTETTSSISVNSSGTYTLTETDLNGCTATSSAVTVTVNSVPTAMGSAVSISGSTVTFDNTSAGATTYLWDFGDASTSTSATPVHTYSTNGNYLVTLVASNGNCSDTITFNTLISVGIQESQSIESVSIYPNPVNTEASVELTLTQSSPLSVSVYDITGKVLINTKYDSVNSGKTTVKLNTTELPSGIYFTTIKIEQSEKTFKMVVVK